MHSTTTGDTLSPMLMRGLADAPHDIRIFEFNPAPMTTTRRVLRRFAPGLAFAEANRQLLAEAKAFRPDVIWLFKGMEVYPRTLDRLREQGSTLVNYNADHPFRYFSRGSGNENVRRSICNYDLHLTYSQAIARELAEQYGDLNVGIVPFGHDVDDALYQRISTDDETLRVCFLGNPDDHRASEIKVLLEAGLPVDVYGHQWDRFLTPAANLVIHGQATGEDMYRTLHRYRVQLNFFRPHNADSHNMRSFEAPASGAIMLAQDSVEHRIFFEPGREAFFFQSRVEMTDLARALLAMPRAEAEAVRRAARQRSVVSKYSYRDRACTALALIEAAHARRTSQH